MLFGNSCPDANSASVKHIIQVTTSDFEEKYLGLPTPDGRMPKGKFQNLHVRLTKCLFNFDGHHQTQAGKEVLIRAIANNPQVQGIRTVFEGRVFNPNLLIRHKGSQRIFASIRSELSIQPHLEINYLQQYDQQHNNMIILIAVVTVMVTVIMITIVTQQKQYVGKSQALDR